MKALSLLPLLCGIALVAGSLHCNPVAARMYQWVSPATGSTQLSGIPPSWYRAGHPGPRVLVFEGGYLLDDTDVEVPDSRQKALRANAFDELQRRRTMEALRRLGKSAEEAEALAKEEEAKTSPAVPVIESSKESVVDTVSELPDVLDAESIDKLKAIIHRYDKRGG